MGIDYKDIGERVRLERKRNRLTQQELAEIVNQTPTNISHIERGATKPGLQTLVDLANALGVTVDYFLCGVTYEATPVLRGTFGELLEDCSHRELMILYETCWAMKESLRKNRETKE